MSKSYSKKDLVVIQKRNPNLFLQIENVASRTKDVKKLLLSDDPDDRIQAYTELFDLCYKYPILFADMQKACKAYTGHGFFRRLDGYNDSSCKYKLALELYDDLVQMDS